MGSMGLDGAAAVGPGLDVLRLLGLGGFQGMGVPMGVSRGASSGVGILCPLAILFSPSIIASLLQLNHTTTQLDLSSISFLAITLF